MIFFGAKYREEEGKERQRTVIVMTHEDLMLKGREGQTRNTRDIYFNFLKLQIIVMFK